MATVVTPSHLDDSKKEEVLIPAGVVVASTASSQYVTYGILIFCFVILLWYAYGKFVENKKKKQITERKTRDPGNDPLADYNLKEAIGDLEDMQKKIVSGLSDDTGL